MTNQTIEKPLAINLLSGLVAIPSLSREEAPAAAWLVGQMAELGYDRAFVDPAGNAVGEIGPADAARTVVLLGHIDTVPGTIPVRVEESESGPILYGRGSVDAKGALATFVTAVARVGSQWAAERNMRLVVVGAVEEEAATSKGARFIRDRFDGQTEPVPDFCIIGEPSDWQRVTLGYKGRLLVEMEASRSMAHTAGPDAGVATEAVAFWNKIEALAATFNQNRTRIFDQLQPSLRHLSTWTDEAMQDRVLARTGIRLPLDCDVVEMARTLTRWAAEQAGIPADESVQVGKTLDRIPQTGGEDYVEFIALGDETTVRLRFHGHEQAWRSDRNNALVRSFMGAIREVGDVRPNFVVKTGTSDMNVVGPAWGCPILAYGPGDSNLDHTPDEHLPLDDYWQAILVLETAIRRLGQE